MTESRLPIYVEHSIALRKNGGEMADVRQGEADCDSHKIFRVFPPEGKNNCQQDWPVRNCGGRGGAVGGGGGGVYSL